MTTTELILAVAAVVLPVLTYFAGIARGKKVREEDRKYETAIREETEKEERIRRVADEYVRNRTHSANFQGLIRAGVLTLENDAEIREACELIATRGAGHPIPGSYRDRMERIDLKQFLKEVSSDDIYLRSGGKMEALIEAFRGEKA